MPRQTPTPSTSNLRGSAASVRAAISGLSGPVADAFTAIAQALDQAQSTIEVLEGRNRELASPDTVDQRRNSTAYVSGDRLIGGVSVQGGLKTLAGQSLDLTLENQVATIAATDHIKGGSLPLNLTASAIKAALASVPVYANNAAAIAGGLSAGRWYRTGADPDPICIVH